MTGGFSCRILRMSWILIACQFSVNGMNWMHQRRLRALGLREKFLQLSNNAQYLQNMELSDVLGVIIQWSNSDSRMRPSPGWGSCYKWSGYDSSFIHSIWKTSHSVRRYLLSLVPMWTIECAQCPDWGDCSLCLGLVRRFMASLYGNPPSIGSFLFLSETIHFPYLARNDVLPLLGGIIEKIHISSLFNFLKWLMKIGPDPLTLGTVVVVLRMIMSQEKGGGFNTSTLEDITREWTKFRRVLYKNLHWKWKQLFFNRTAQSAMALAEAGKWTGLSTPVRVAIPHPRERPFSARLDESDYQPIAKRLRTRRSDNSRPP